jgi:hypothetical protein
LKFHTTVSQSFREVMAPVLENCQLAVICSACDDDRHLMRFLDDRTPVLNDEPKVRMLSGERHRSPSHSSANVDDQASWLESMPGES